MRTYQTGRIANPDPRDKKFPVKELLTTIPNLTEKHWWANGWWGDQGKTSMCVCYSWTHFIEDGPVIQDNIPSRDKPLLYIPQFYDECQKRDPWEGNSYDGTSVRAGAKILKELNVISEYRWAFTVDEITQTLLTLGPMVVGTNWYEHMFRTDRKGYVRPRGRQHGGHAYLLNGVDTKEKCFYIKNSWGKSWGDNGTAKITFQDFAYLLRKGGEACIAFEYKLDEVPDLNSLKKVD